MDFIDKYWHSKRIVKGGVKDSPQRLGVNDHIALQVGRIKLPREVDLGEDANFKAWHQGKTMHCTSYGVGGCMDSLEGMYHPVDGVDHFIDPLKLWKGQLKTGASEKYGDYLQNAVENARKNGCNGIKLAKYKRTRDKSDWRQLMIWLARKQPIFTGFYTTKDSRYGTNHMRAMRTGILPLTGTKTGGAHAVWLRGYHYIDDVLHFKLQDSYGESGPDSNGVYNVPYTDIERTMSQYIIFNNRK